MPEPLLPSTFASDLQLAADQQAPVQPLSSQFPSTTPAEAYEVQVGVAANLIRMNDPLIGAKVTAHQRRPIFAFYPRSALMGTFEVVDLSQLIAPCAQPVLVFRLFKELAGIDVTVGQVRDATQAVVAGVEVIDYRMQPLEDLQPVDLIADNGGVAKIMVGEHGTDIAMGDDDLSSVKASFVVNDQVAPEPPDPITAPIEAVAALASHLGQQGGKLEADWFVVVGPLAAPVPIEVGSKIELEVDGMGPVRLRAR